MTNNFYDNFDAAMSRLVDFCENFNGSDVERAGVIQAFEFTFEQSWKALQKRAGAEGVTIASPKKAFEWAMSNGWIDSGDEADWLQMIQDRNLTTHTYRNLMAEEISQRIFDRYKGLYQELLKRMKS